MISEKEFGKLTPAEQKKCFPFEVTEDFNGVAQKGKGPQKMYAMPKDTARTLVCKHLGGEVPIAELYTPKVFTDDVLHLLDENIIKKTFMLPDIESLEDLAEVTGDLMDEAEMGEITLTEEQEQVQIDDTGLEGLERE